MDYRFIFWPEATVWSLKCLDGFVSCKHATLALKYINWWTGVVWITCGLLWCFYQLFGLSFWRHPFTAEHPLVSKWCNATFSPIWWRNKLIYILDDLRVSTFSAKKKLGGWTFPLITMLNDTLYCFSALEMSVLLEKLQENKYLCCRSCFHWWWLGIKHQTRGLFSEQFIKH